MIAFCSEIRPGGNARYPFYFTRRDPLDPEGDFSSRNSALYDYVLAMMRTKVPGYGKSFEEKFGDRDTRQILTSIYDYIRATNLRDASTKEAQTLPLTSEGQITGA